MGVTRRACESLGEHRGDPRGFDSRRRRAPAAITDPDGPAGRWRGGEAVRRPSPPIAYLRPCVRPDRILGFGWGCGCRPPEGQVWRYAVPCGASCLIP